MQRLDGAVGTSTGPSEGADAAEVRRWEILNAAAELFHQQGFQSTSTQNIADRVGILKGSLYHYIRSKNDLLYAIIDAVHTEMDDNVRRVEDLDGTAGERVIAFVEGHLDVCLNNMTWGRVYAHELEQLDDERRDQVVARRADYDQVLRSLLAEAQAEGSVRSDLDPRLLATVTLASLTSVYRWYEPGRSLRDDEVKRAYAALVLSGLMTDQESVSVDGHRSESPTEATT